MDEDKKMENLTNHRNIILKVVTLILLFNTTLFATKVNSEEVNNVQPFNSTVSSMREAPETTEIYLDSFGTLGIILMVALSSLLGAYFVKDEFSKGLG